MMIMTLAKTPIEISDENLATTALNGDPKAFGMLVSRYRDVAFAYALACLGNRDEAEDIAQEAFVKAFQSLKTFRGSGSWSSWFMRILRNSCVDALRKRRGRKTEPLNIEMICGAPSLESTTLAKERSETLNNAIANLPEKFRIPILMHYSSHQTVREIAIALDLPESTVSGRLAGALRKLRHHLK